MSEIRDAIAAELERHKAVLAEIEGRIATLREMDALAIGLDGDTEGSQELAVPEPEPEPEPAGEETPSLPASTETRKERRTAKAQATARDHDAKIMSVLLNSNRPLSAGEIREQTGLSGNVYAGRIRELVIAGKVIGEGKTAGRRYRPAGTGESDNPSTRGKKRNANELDTSVSRVVLRDHVRKAIAADSLTEADLVERFGESNALADAIQWLVEHREIVLDEDGTYARRNGSLVAA